MLPKEETFTFFVNITDKIRKRILKRNKNITIKESTLLYHCDYSNVKDTTFFPQEETCRKELVCQWLRRTYKLSETQLHR